MSELQHDELLQTEAAVETAEAPEADKAADTAAAETADTAAAEAPAESMDDYKDELEASFRQIHTGDMLEGSIIDITDEYALIDLGYYTDGIIYTQDASDDPSYILKEHLEIGQSVRASVVRRDDGAGHIQLSMKEAAALEAWDRLRELLASGDNVTVKITDTTKAGAIAYLEGIRGFIPASKLALQYVEEDALSEWVGRSIAVRVIAADEGDSHLVMSAKEILREQQQEEKAAKISNVEVGLVTEGVVRTLKPYGAFVELSNGLDGLVHISQISQKRINSPSAVLKEGQQVKVKIIGNKDGKLSLSMKALEDVMAAEVEEETVELPDDHDISISLGSLLANLKL